MSAKHFLLSFALLSICFSFSSAIQCEDPSGRNVDFWSILKYPNKTQMNPQENNRYAYYDSSMTGSSFNLRDQYVDVDGEPLERLVVALNQKFKSLNLIAWNDGFFSSTSNKAHSKGIIAYDESTDQGIYLVHSVPDFPAVKDNQFDTIIPENNRIYGQSFLCMSLDGDSIETIADGLLLENIEIYFQDFSSSKLKKTQSLAEGNNIKSPNSDVINFKTAVKGVTITGFFKNAYDTSIGIYEDVIVPGLKTSLFVESWGRPYMASDCSLSGGKFTKNILNIKVTGDSYGIWQNTQDHSKWAVSASNSAPYVCIGDMNRQASQSKRGGGAFCIRNSGMWGAFNSIIDQFEDCSSTRSFLE